MTNADKGITWKKDSAGVLRAYGSYCYQGKRNDNYALRNWNKGVEPGNGKQAQAAMERFREDIRQGKFPLVGNVAQLTGSMSFADYIDYYTREYVEAQRAQGHMRGKDYDSIAAIMRRDDIAKLSLKDLEGGTAAILAFLGRLRNEPLVMKVRKKDGKLKEIPLKRKRRKATVDKFIIRLSAMFNFAKSAGLMDVTPFERDGKGLLDKQAVNEGRKRRLTAGEEKALRSQMLDTLMTDRFDFALETGVRRGELLGLKFKHIDFVEEKVLVEGQKTVTDKDGFDVEVSATKSGLGRSIPLSEVALAAVKRRKQVVREHKFGKNVELLQGAEKALREAYVFGDNFGLPVENFKTAWNSLKERAGLSDEALEDAGKMPLHWHDLRGECCTRLLEKGGEDSAVLVMKIMGHAELKTTLAHYTGAMDKAMKKLVRG